MNISLVETTDQKIHFRSSNKVLFYDAYFLQNKLPANTEKKAKVYAEQIKEKIREEKRKCATHKFRKICSERNFELAWYGGKTGFDIVFEDLLESNQRW